MYTSSNSYTRPSFQCNLGRKNGEKYEPARYENVAEDRDPNRSFGSRTINCQSEKLCVHMMDAPEKRFFSRMPLNGQCLFQDQW